MIRFSAVFLLALPVAAAFAVAPALAQLPPPGVYEERLPPVMDNYDDDDLPPRAGQWQVPKRVLPYPDDDAAAQLPPGYFRAPVGRAAGYGHQFDPQQPGAAGPPSGVTNDPEALRPPGAVGTVPRGSPPSATAAGNPQ